MQKQTDTDSYSDQYQHALLYPNCEEHVSHEKKDFTTYCDYFKAYCPIRVFRPCLKRVGGKHHTISIAGVDISSVKESERHISAMKHKRKTVAVQANQSQRYKK